MKYVGQTTQPLHRRWWQHCNSKQKHCRRLHYAIQKYGKNSFKIEIIAKANSIGDLNQLEKNFIESYNTLSPNGYNLLKGGDNKKHHPESRLKMSKTRTGKKVPALCVPRGPMSLLNRRSLSLAKKGKGNGLLGKKRKFKEVPSKWKPIAAMDMKTGQVTYFVSVKDAASRLNKHHSNIVACLKGRKKTAYGFYWAYSGKRQVAYRPKWENGILLNPVDSLETNDKK
jgi:group I intron endonuclease